MVSVPLWHLIEFLVKVIFFFLLGCRSGQKEWEFGDFTSAGWGVL